MKAIRKERRKEYGVGVRLSLHVNIATKKAQMQPTGWSLNMITVIDNNCANVHFAVFLGNAITKAPQALFCFFFFFPLTYQTKSPYTYPPASPIFLSVLR